MGAAIAAEPGMRVAAVGSRSLARAQALAATLEAESAYGSYEELCADPGVDAIYVATPHAQHLQVAEAAIAAGKAVLCEKPLAATVQDAEKMVRLAREAGVFLMEAMWMRFNPLVRRIAEDPRFGEIRSVQASFGFAAPYDPAHRLWAPSWAAGRCSTWGSTRSGWPSSSSACLPTCVSPAPWPPAGWTRRRPAFCSTPAAGTLSWRPHCSGITRTRPVL
ncbi:oxidoreductase-like [[Actinomadura] parvosata subsp. kistnae]|nr:oxidoreductase-like [Actinomadura parvosata subsp. kistnae]